MQTYECYDRRNKTETSTAWKIHATSNVQNIYVTGSGRSKWEDNVKMDRTSLREGGRAMDSSGLVEGQVIVSCERCNKLSISIKCSEFIN